MMLLNWIFRASLLLFSFSAGKGWLPFFGQEMHRHLMLESHHKEWDILQLLNINGSQTGVSKGKGPIKDAPAWKLKSLYDNIQVNASVVDQISASIVNEVSLYFVFKQHKNTIGSLLSVNLPGKIRPLFQVISNLKTHRLNILYRIKEDTKSHQATFKLPEKAGWKWTRLLVSLNRTTVRVWINCGVYDKQELTGTANLTIPKDSLIYFRQEPGLRNKFIGSIQMAKVLNFSAQDRFWRCSYDMQFGPNWRPPLLG